MVTTRHEPERDRDPPERVRGLYERGRGPYEREGHESRMTEFRGLLHGARLPSGGRHVRFRLRPRALSVRDPDATEIPYEKIRSRAGGWQGQNLILEWDDETGTQALSIGDDEARALLVEPPAAFMERLRPWLRQREGAKRGRQVAIAVAAVALLTFGFAVFSFFAVSGRLADVAIQRVPVAWEEQLGQSVQARVTAGADLVTEGEAARVLRELGSRLADQVDSPYTFRFHLVADPQVNAMAAPGGFITVYAGLVRSAETPEELAGVLAHEIQHVVQRHSLRAMVRGLGLRVTLGLLLGGTGVLEQPLAGMIEHFAGLRFSRHQELDADTEGVRLLQRAGIAPDGMIRFFERLSESSTEIPEFLSTHPASQERADRLLDLIDPSVRAGSLDYDWDRVRAELETLEASGEAGRRP